MMICEDCREIFSDDEVVKDYDEATGYTLNTCPYCASDDISDARQDKLTGEWITDTYRLDYSDTTINKVAYYYDLMITAIADEGQRSLSRGDIMYIFDEIYDEYLRGEL